MLYVAGGALKIHLVELSEKASPKDHLAALAEERERDKNADF